MWIYTIEYKQYFDNAKRQNVYLLVETLFRTGHKKQKRSNLLLFYHLLIKDIQS